MASYDQLSAQQRAIVDLILKRGQGYDQLADTLGMPVARVRELAREALTDLAPVSAAAVDEGWRTQIADYLLDQQGPAEATATRSHLRRSEAARAWSRSVLDSLEHLYPNGSLPTIPAGDAGPEPKPERAKPAPTPRRELSPEAQAVVRRRRIAGAAAAAILLLLALLVWPIGLLTGDDDSSGEQSRAAGSSDDAGIAIVTRQKNGNLSLGVQAQLEPTGRNNAYEVWLYNSPDDARSLGAQVTDAQGRFAGIAALPRNYRRFRFIDVSRETVDTNRSHSGRSILRAPTAEIAASRPTNQRAQNGATLVGQAVLRPVEDS
jgi:Anti-sigma-K factor rskA